MTVLRRESTLPRVALLVFVALCLAAAVAGFWQLNRFGAEPGASGAAADWPADVGIARAAGRSTLVMALHPECSCSEATVGELSAALAGMRHPPQVVALFADYGLADSPPEKSPLWTAAGALPGALRMADRDARLAARFGAVTSGEVRLYDPAGRLVFVGGVTGSRGHPGDNPARRGLIAAIEHPGATTTRMPVFGCSLTTPESERPFPKS